MNDTPKMRQLGTLWIGGPLSWLEYLCLSSFAAKGQPITLFTYGDVGPIPKGVIQRDGREILDTDDFIKYGRKDSYALFADLFRMHMVAKCSGMIWVDTDTYCHAPITLKAKYVFGVENDRGSIANGVFGAPANSKLLQNILTFMQDRFPIPPFLAPNIVQKYKAAKESGNPVNITEMPWGTWGPKCLTWFANETNTASKAQQEEVFYPIPYGKRRVFLREGEHIDRFITPKSTAINVFASNKTRMVNEDNGLPPKGCFFDTALKMHNIDPKEFPITFSGRKSAASGKKRSKSKLKAQQSTLLAGFVETVSPRLTEWIAHHRAIGFDKIVLVVAQDAIDNDQFIKSIGHFDWVKLVPIKVSKTSNFQPAAIRELRDVPELRQADWVLFLMVDEFLQIQKSAQSVSELMKTLAEADAVSVVSRSFSHSDPTNNIPDAVTKSLTRCQPLADPANKRQYLRSFYRPSKFSAVGKHRPIADPDQTEINWLNGAGEPIKQSASEVGWAAKGDLLTYGLLQINRYPLPSAAEFLLASAAKSAELPDDAGLLYYLQQQWLTRSDATSQINDLAKVSWEKTHKMLRQMRSDNTEFAKSEKSVWGSYQADAQAKLQDPLGRSFAKWLQDGAIAPEAPVDESMSQTPALWIQDIYPGGNAQGSYSSLENHAICMVERKKDQLWISFDNLGPVNDKSVNRDPWAYKYIRDLGQSHLGIMARRKDWYRDAELIENLQSHAKPIAKKDYSQVILTGTSMGAFAALAFAPMFPNCRVIAFNPQSTLNEATVPWETRYGMGRAQDWSLPYGDASDGLRAASKAYVFYDPYMELDKKHIQRLSGENLTVLKTWYSNHFSPVILRRMDQLKTVMNACADGTMNDHTFYNIYRNRRRLVWYKKALAKHALELNHPKLEKRINSAFKNKRRI